jgi:hypothetical protein
MKTKIHYSLDTIKNIVDEIMPPKNNHLIGCFKVEFLISSKSWDYTSDEIEITNQRGFSYLIKKASLQQEIDILKSYLDEYYEYYDDHAIWKYQVELRERIKKLEDENKIWLLQELSKGLARF